VLLIVPWTMLGAAAWWFVRRGRVGDEPVE